MCKHVLSREVRKPDSAVYACTDNTDACKFAHTVIHTCRDLKYICTDTNMCLIPFEALEWVIHAYSLFMSVQMKP